MAIIKTFQTSEELAYSAATHFATLAEDAIDDHGKFSVALAGGSTPTETYQTLATIEFAQQVDWERVHVFWGDERPVPPTHPDSNYKRPYEILLNPLAVREENIHRIQGENEPAQAALNYEKSIRHHFGGDSPRFDLILLGMGADGHTASLFPGTQALHEDSRWVIAHHIDKLNSERITFTPKLINAAANVTFLVTGEHKAERLRHVLSGRYQPDHWPAQIIRPTNGKLYWFVDSHAAKFL